MNLITSKNNQKIKDLVKLRDDSKYSSNKSLFYVEGFRIIKDTSRSLIKEIYILDKKISDYYDIINVIDEKNVYIVNQNVFDKIKNTKNSQGIIAIVSFNLLSDIRLLNFDNLNTCIILDNINDPGNLGTIIRLSEACNISLIIISSDSCSIYNPKVIRSSMSSIFRSNIYISDNLINDIMFLKKMKYNICSTVLNKHSKRFDSINYLKNNVIVFGNEANGIKDEIINLSNDLVFIPMCGQIESLNVSISATAIFYEIMRQNNYYET